METTKHEFIEALTEFLHATKTLDRVWANSEGPLFHAPEIKYPFTEDFGDLKHKIEDWIEDTRQRMEAIKQDLMPNSNVETVSLAENTGGHIYNDIITLKNGHIIRISEDGISIYKDDQADENGNAAISMDF